VVTAKAVVPFRTKPSGSEAAPLKLLTEMVADDAEIPNPSWL
jgi:hypothetical protein